jgi:hypothetical protein
MNDILKTALTDPCVMHRTCKAEESSVPSQFHVTLKMVSAQGFRVMILEPGKTKLKDDPGTWQDKVEILQRT